MRKIPTVFERSDDRRSVVDRVTPGCEWALAGEGVGTRKYDGTCVMFDGASWWTRREVKPGRTIPDGFVFVVDDEVTGKIFGWLPAANSGFRLPLEEAIEMARHVVLFPGTYELCGPAVNGDPEHFERHVLVPHDRAQVIPLAYPVDFDGLRSRFMSGWRQEGIVWHHPDGRMAKLKVRDFR